MINLNTVKAILAFYLQVKYQRWGMATDENMKLPTDEKSLNKIKLVCKLYYNLQHNRKNNLFLSDFCDKLEAIENKEKADHHSQWRILPPFTKTWEPVSLYPMMSCVIRALRSHIRNPDNQISDDKLQQYINDEFLKVIKYEDKKCLGSKYQNISSIKDFTTQYKDDMASFSLLDRVYLLNYKTKHSDREESTAAAAIAIATIQNLKSNNFQREASIATLFADKSSRKNDRVKKCGVTTVANPKNSVEALTNAVGEIEIARGKFDQFPTLSMAMKR